MGFMHSWSLQNYARVKIRLFANVSAEFKRRMIECVRVSCHASGTTIVKEGEASTDCLFLAHGEAEVRFM